MAELPATRANALALGDEQALMRQGFTFLDEKRMLLAAETLRRLEEHRVQEAALVDALRAAADALRAALQRHGRAGLAAQPATPPHYPPDPVRSCFLGVTLWAVGPASAAQDAQDAQSAQDAHDTPPALPETDPGADPSPEARACRTAFAALLGPLAALAASAGNLERLGAEYRRTERRALALENVLLPEVTQALAAIDEHLTLADQEEAVRIRQAARSA
jgi:V/A-type H+/Na+-transporting ATPase subunit D